MKDKVVNVRRRILVVDGNESFRYSLTRHLTSQPDFEVVGESASSDEAVPAARSLAPDVILLDIELRETDAPGAIRELRQAAPGARIIGVSIVQSGRYSEECRLAGSHAQLLKDSPVEVLFEVIRTA
jgi:DNA-binding NarL/FixJ family response regulator